MKSKVIWVVIYIFFLGTMSFGQMDSLDEASYQDIETELELDDDDENYDYLERPDTFYHVKRQFDDDYRRRYQSDDYDYGIKPPKKGLFQKFLEWLFGPSDSVSKPSNAGIYVVWIIRVLVFIIILYAVYAIVSILLGKKGNWLFAVDDKKRVLTFQISEENIHEDDFKALYEQSVKNGNFRMAIRYRYLMLLQMLVIKGVIKYHKDKTNSDYYYEIKDKKLSSAFSYVSYIYEHVWYGGFDFEMQEFNMAVKAFDHTSIMLRNE